MADTIKTGNYFYEHGYVMVSNLLIDYQDRLGITDDEFNFIVKVLRHKSGFKIHDANLSSTVSTKTLQRRRKSLVEKGYLTFEAKKSRKEDGTITTEGIVYDFSALEIALIELSNEIKEKESEVKISKKETIKTEATDPLADFKREYFNRYNTEYVVSADDKRKLKNMKKEEKESLKYIFNYVDDNITNLPESFHPRLAFFTQLGWRMEKLVEYSELKKEEMEEAKRTEQLIKEENAAKEIYSKLFPSTDEEDKFIQYLIKNDRKLFLKTRTCMMKDIVDEIVESYSNFIGECYAK